MVDADHTCLCGGIDTVARSDGRISFLLDGGLGFCGIHGRAGDDGIDLLLRRTVRRSVGTSWMVTS